MSERETELKPTRRFAKGKEWSLVGTRQLKAEAEREAKHIRKTSKSSVRIKKFSGGWAIYVRSRYNVRVI